MSPRGRSFLGAACWTLAVISVLLTAAAFAGGGVPCQAGTRGSCPPQTLVLVVGVLVTLAFGATGAILRKPRSRREPRFPWEYPD